MCTTDFAGCVSLCSETVCVCTTDFAGCVSLCSCETVCVCTTDFAGCVSLCSCETVCVCTTDFAEKLTEAGRGKHFIGDFLPPDELERFMETFKVSSPSSQYSTISLCLLTVVFSLDCQGELPKQ